MLTLFSVRIGEGSSGLLRHKSAARAVVEVALV